MAAYKEMADEWAGKTYKKYEYDPIALINHRNDYRLRPIDAWQSPYKPDSSGSTRSATQLIITGVPLFQLNYLSLFLL